MERRYLAAILAMAATFALVSRAVESGLAQRALKNPPSLMSGLKCATRAVGAKLLARISPSLRPEDLDAVRLLAKLNLGGFSARPAVPQSPAEPVQIRIAAPVSQMDCAEMQRAQEQAIRNAERMQRDSERMQLDMQRMQAKMERVQNRLEIRTQAFAEPVVVELPSAAEIDRQVELSIGASKAQMAHLKIENMGLGTTEGQNFTALPQSYPHLRVKQLEKKQLMHRVVDAHPGPSMHL
jgi:hypothetical protein